MSRQNVSILLILILLGLFLSANVAAQGHLGSEFQINAYTTGSQNEADVAMDAQGSFVAVWHSAGSNGSDQNSTSILGQRFNSIGGTLGTEFQANTYTPNGQTNAVVARAPSGSFVVVWESNGALNGDALGTSIQAQRYDSVGNPVDAQFLVNSFTTGNQNDPAIAMDSEGDFVIAWGSYGSPSGDSLAGSIQGRRYSSNGNSLGSQFQVNIYTPSYQRQPGLGMNASGDFLIVWESDGSFGGDTILSSIQAQRYASGGNAIGSQFQVNSYSNGYQREADVAVSPQGDFAVVWSSYGPNGGDLDLSIQGQRYNSSGGAIGPQFQIGEYTSSFQATPKVAMASSGAFTVAWADYGYLDSNPDSYSVQGRSFSSEGQALSPQFQINSFTQNNQFSPAIAMASGGDFITLWTSLGSSGSDTEARSIQGQRFRGGLIFADGFETGDASSWSSTNP